LTQKQQIVQKQNNGSIPKNKTHIFCFWVLKLTQFTGLPKTGLPRRQAAWMSARCEGTPGPFSWSCGAAMFGWQSEAPLNDNQANSI